MCGKMTDIKVEMNIETNIEFSLWSKLLIIFDTSFNIKDYKIKTL